MTHWVSTDVRLPKERVEVLVCHILGDRDRCPRAYDVAAYWDGAWHFPWDRTNQNPEPQWVLWWMPIPKEPDKPEEDRP